MRDILPWLRSRVSREWTEIPADERTAVFASLAASVGIPLSVVLVLDPMGALLRPLRFWLLVLGLPAWAIARVMYRWLQADESFVWALLRDLRPDPLGALAIGDHALRRLPLVTIALLTANVTIHYSVVAPIDYSMRTADPSLWLWTNFTSMFMHANQEHLWGNMLFLWIFGSEVEPRIGRARYLAYYFLAGSAGHVLSLAFYYWAAGDDRVMSLGASGAIMGLAGLFVVRCYFARIGVPIPILGGLGAALPVGYRLRVNAMVLVGAYFCFDLLGARSDLQGDWTGINHMAHLGGYCFGLCIAYGTGLAREGRRELLELRAKRPTDLGHPGPDREARDRVLERNPENVPLRIARARDRSKYVLRSDAREDYETAIRSLLKREPTDAASLFGEFFQKYGTPLSPKEQLALTPTLERLGKLDLAARALELTAEASGIEAADRERALLRQAMLLVAMGLSGAAIHVYEKLLREQPSSRAIVEAKLERCRAASAVGPV